MNHLLRTITFRILDGKLVDGHPALMWDDSGPHADPFSRLYYIDGGRGTVEYAGRTYQLKAGSYYLFPAHFPILHRPSPGLVQYYVHFTAHIPGALSLFDVTRWTCDRAAQNRAEARRQMQQMMPPQEEPAAALRAQAALQNTIAAHLHGMAVDDPERVRQLHRFNAVIEYIHQHLDERISVSELARISSLHPNYFSNLFADIVGTPPREYIVQKRIERAQLLLWQTDLRIGEVADRAGAESPAYFCRIFKKRVGMSPREYRRQRSP